MAKAEWGDKHICAECGVRYYDLCRKPITCPKCGVVFTPEPPAKPKARRGASAASKAAASEKAKPAPGKEAKPAPEPVESEAEKTASEPEKAIAALAKAGDVVVESSGDDKEGDNLIEDPSELGEDEDDMAEVVDTSAENKEDR
jgi:uncharacterized protein (TIGR02300 family)